MFPVSWDHMYLGPFFSVEVANSSKQSFGGWLYRYRNKSLLSNYNADSSWTKKNLTYIIS